MHVVRVLLSAVLLAAAAAAHAASDDTEDWQLFGRVLSLVQSFARIAAESPDPQAMQKGIDTMISGRNAEANRLAGELLDGMFEDMPAQYKGTVASIARDFAVVARREQARAAERADSRIDPRIDPIVIERTLQARKDLHAMGLRYHDAAQFFDAVKRDDALAVELYMLGRGVNLGARDSDGRSALEIARRSGNAAIVRLLETAG